jgi:hypothetical protein
MLVGFATCGLQRPFIIGTDSCGSRDLVPPYSNFNFVWSDFDTIHIWFDIIYTCGPWPGRGSATQTVKFDPFTPARMRLLAGAPKGRH